MMFNLFALRPKLCFGFCESSSRQKLNCEIVTENKCCAFGCATQPCSFLVCSVHRPIPEEKSYRDGSSLHPGVGHRCPAPRDGCRHAGAGRRPSAEINEPRERNAEQSDESAGTHEWEDQPRKPREKPPTGGQDPLPVPLVLLEPLTRSGVRASATVSPLGMWGQVWVSTPLAGA